MNLSIDTILVIITGLISSITILIAALATRRKTNAETHKEIIETELNKKQAEQDLNEKISSYYQKTIIDMQKRISELEVEQSKSRAVKDRLEHKIDDLEAKLDDTKRELTKSLRENESLRVRIVELEKQVKGNVNA